MACLCSFSKLIIDANRNLLADELYAHSEELKEIELSSYERIGRYYGLYYEILKEALEWIHPLYHVSIHTKKNLPQLEFLYKGDEKIAKAFVDNLKKKGIQSDSKESVELDVGINREIELAFLPDCQIRSFRINVAEEVATSGINRQGLITEICETSKEVFAPN
eukprot:TRINITY_DN6821_c0_g1_i7.p1 TRINITY_DN6821_c0_g1~~TRINITY_DN6821_c0_g1_i7.p1  ORF type:complete len:164 (-),score=28.22 TRINITY_DN6821_c0_g1_i7:112-603(-)